MTIKVHLFGDYAHRLPFAYDPIRQSCAPMVEVTDVFEAADVIVLSHTKDIERHAETLVSRLAANQRVVLLSKEPFWDCVHVAVSCS